MSAGKLSIKEIENKIQLLQDRIETMKMIIKDISDPATKEVLKLQWDQYKGQLDSLQKELARRKNK